MSARARGIFAKHGLNVELLFIQLNSTMRAKFIKLPPPVIKTMRLTPLKATVEPAEIRFRLDVMKSQNMLSHDIDVDKMIWR